MTKDQEKKRKRLITGMRIACIAITLLLVVSFAISREWQLVYAWLYIAVLWIFIYRYQDGEIRAITEFTDYLIAELNKERFDGKNPVDEAVANAAKDLTAKLDAQFAIALKPRPWYCPPFLYRKIIKDSVEIKSFLTPCTKSSSTK